MRRAPFMTTPVHPSLRIVKSPLDESQLAPLDPRCQCVQFAAPLTDNDHVKLASFLASYPDVSLRVYGHYTNPLANLSFLRHYPFISSFQADVFSLQSTDGVEYLTDSLKFFGLGETKTSSISLSFLRRFKSLKDLHLVGHKKDIEIISSLSCLEQLSLRSITLPNLKVVLPLEKLKRLNIRLGGTSDLKLLPQLTGLQSLELWMIKGLDNLGMLGNVASLRNLYLQDLKHVRVLPSFAGLHQLRRVTLDGMKGITDLRSIADAPALEELLVVSAKHLMPEDFKPFVGHPTLKAARIGLGSISKNNQVRDLLALPECDLPK
ncbi:MAG: hypothetical protein WCP40_05985 [Opitutae bacterium]